MEDWPEGWYRDEPARRPADDDTPGGGSQRDRRVGSAGPVADAPGRFPVRNYSRRDRPAGPAGGYGGERGGGYPDNDATARYGYGGGGGDPWPAQPPLRSAPGQGAPGQGAPGQGAPPRGAPPRPRGGRGPRRRGHRGKRILQVIGAIVLIVILAAGGFYLYLNSKLTRINVLAGYSGQPAAGAGQNWLLTGSDSREGLTTAQENQLSLGRNVAGERSDSVLLLHIPSGGGRPVLVSLPRDSYVPIPGHGDNKLNAAFSIGGPQLLAQTVQNITGLRIEHYMGIGFGGLVNVVNDVGGVRMCLPTPLKNAQAGINLKAGCQNLDGAQALGFVRDRHSFANGDLQRIQDQRAFLKALLSKATSAGTLVNPFASIPAAIGAVSDLQVDQGTQLYQLVKVGFALRNPETTTVPIATANYPTAAGDAVLWNKAQASQLFTDLNNDTTPPSNLISGSQVG